MRLQAESYKSNVTSLPTFHFIYNLAEEDVNQGLPLEGCTAEGDEVCAKTNADNHCHVLENGIKVGNGKKCLDSF